MNFLNKYELKEIFLFFYNGLKKGAISTRASSIAFNFFLAFFPALIFLFTLIPYIPVNDFQKRIFEIIIDILPPMTNDSVLFLINDVLSNPRAELLSIGFLLTIFFSTNGAYSLLEAFDASYHVNNEIGFFKKRLIALEITIIITLLVILSILFIILGEKLISFLISENLVNISSIKMFMFSKWLILFASLYSGITIIFFLANKKAKFRFINIGSVFSSLFIIITSILFSIYINNFDTYNKLYGSIGTLMIILLWMYFNSFILILGFELNTTFSKKINKNAS
ncbi:YihY/virulence factor BrkB family protein [Bacteroidota bacterium]|nr:YihY/virulence factor BrkB family protein [Bacteroidota bacterium]